MDSSGYNGGGSGEIKPHPITDELCQPANLKYIDFIRVQTGVNAKAGWLGENSTEVFGFTDENINQGK